MVLLKQSSTNTSECYSRSTNKHLSELSAFLSFSLITFLLGRQRFYSLFLNPTHQQYLNTDVQSTKVTSSLSFSLSPSPFLRYLLSLSLTYGPLCDSSSGLESDQISKKEVNGKEVKMTWQNLLYFIILVKYFFGNIIIQNFTSKLIIIVFICFNQLLINIYIKISDTFILYMYICRKQDNKGIEN